MFVPFARSQDSSQLDVIARAAAKQIEKSAKKNSAGTTVLVVDFARHDGPASELGVKLADEFADSLRKEANGFAVVDRKDYQQAMTKEGIAPEQAASPEIWPCLGYKLKADLIVRGTLESRSNELILKIEVARFADMKGIFQADAKLPMTSEMQAQSSSSPAAPPKTPAPKQVLWVSPDHPPVSDEQTVTYKELAKRGYSYPRCAVCSSAGLSEKTYTVRFNSTVELMTQIDTNGFPTKITLIRGAPCDLTGKAVEVVSKWRFKPAMAPHGVPVAVEEPIEVTFHLY